MIKKSTFQEVIELQKLHLNRNDFLDIKLNLLISAKTQLYVSLYNRLYIIRKKLFFLILYVFAVHICNDKHDVL